MMENGKRTFEEILVIIFVGITIAWACYYVSKEPQVEGGNIYISGAVQDNRQTNGTKTGEKTAGNTDLNIGENKIGMKQQTAGTSSQGDSKDIQSQQRVSNSTRVLVRGFAEDSIATITNTIYYNEVGIDMNMTMKGENGSFELTRQSSYIDKNGKRERSFGQCQLMEVYHAPFIWKDGYTEIRPGYYKVSNPSGFSDDFLDPVKHAMYCVSLWKDAEKKGRLSTTFYAYPTRHKYKNDFTIVLPPNKK